jgi:hypothetical protein
MNVVLAYERPEPSTLADQAEVINKEFDRLDRAEKRIEDRHNAMLASERAAAQVRWRLGHELLRAKELLDKEHLGASFEAWCEANIKRSMRDIYQGDESRAPGDIGLPAPRRARGGTGQMGQGEGREPRQSENTSAIC